MRRLKKISITSYIVTILTASEILMALFMFFFFYYYSDVIIESEIRKELKEQNKEIREDIKFSKNGISYDWKEIYEMTGIYTLVYYKNEMIKIPDMPVFLNKIGNKEYSKGVKRIKIGEEIYYYKDFKLNRYLNNKTVVRHIVNIDNISSHYITTIRIGYYAIIVVSILTFIIAILTGKYLRGSFKKIKAEVESIGQTDDIARRIDYDGPFVEMQILCDAENRMLNRMEKYIGRQRQYISDVSHELRTPISVIMAQAEYGQKKDIALEERIHAFSVIRKQSGKMNELVMTLLELSRLDQENYKIAKEEIHLEELVNFVCEGIIENSDQEVNISYELKPVFVRGDIHLLSIAISNLVINAIKYSEEGDKIIVACGETEKEVYVSIKDQGIGISKENQKMIFERFYKAEKSRTTKGYGLGLPLAQRIAQLHDGCITVESEEKKGSTFTILFRK